MTRFDGGGVRGGRILVFLFFLLVLGLSVGVAVQLPACATSRQPHGHVLLLVGCAPIVGPLRLVARMSESGGQRIFHGVRAVPVRVQKERREEKRREKKRKEKISQQIEKCKEKQNNKPTLTHAKQNKTKPSNVKNKPTLCRRPR